MFDLNTITILNRYAAKGERAPLPKPLTGTFEKGQFAGISQTGKAKVATTK